NVSIDADFRASGNRGRSHGLSNGTGAAAGEGRATFKPILGSAHQQEQAAARGPRSEKGSENSASGNDGAEQLNFEPFCSEVSHGHRSPAQKAVHVFFAEIAEAAAGLEQAPHFGGAGTVHIGRRLRQYLPQDPADTRQNLLKFAEGAGVLHGKFGNLTGRLGGAVVKKKSAAIERGCEDFGLGRDYLEAVLIEFHLAHDIGANRTGGVGKRGAAKSGMKFFGDRAATRLRAAFDKKRLESCLGEIEGRHQAIVARANDHDIAWFRHYWTEPPFQSLRISSAASRPGAPMMPPPGCVAEPHI